ncbi:glycosyltransferase [Actinoallomurus sp. WRP6H-15]|nr:glycosyltransferase [Actinoallomurus soli]
MVATWNRRRELERTLARLRALPKRPPVIVVDNASSDGTADLVATGFPDVRLVVLPANRGGAARNIGVRLARTPYVAFSDDDSWWEPRALHAAVRALDRHPRLAVLVARIDLGDGRLDHVSRKMAQGALGREPDLPGPSVLLFPACAAVVRRDAFLDVGGFDELLFFGGEESLPALDLAVSGWGLAYVPEVTARHAPSGLRGDSARRLALHRRNDLLVTWMRLSAGRALRRTGALAIEALRDPLARDTLRQVLLRLPAALARRRRVPRAWERRLEVLHELE